MDSTYHFIASLGGRVRFPKCFVKSSSETHTTKYSFSSADLYFDICISKYFTLKRIWLNFVCLKCFHLRPNLEYPATCLHHQYPAKQQKRTTSVHFPARTVRVTARCRGFSISPELLVPSREWGTFVLQILRRTHLNSVGYQTASLKQTGSVYKGQHSSSLSNAETRYNTEE